MKIYLQALALLGSVLGLAACGGDGDSAATASPDDFKIGGTWEAELPDLTDSLGTHKFKGKVTFSENTYTYSWSNRLVGTNSQVVYDWTETARETGSVSATPEYMEWTAESFGEAEYNQADNTWSTVEMKSSKSDYAIKYKLEGDKLTLMEDINLDGDYDDVFQAPETLIYTRVN
ncbi:MAG: hypothetical protein M3436_03755 [Pseudomonadota bacterium]|nr:hypothetical protein [Pseudomonadota bacterium]